MRAKLRLLFAAGLSALLVTMPATTVSANPVPKPSEPAPEFETQARTGPWEIFIQAVQYPYPCMEIKDGSTANNARAQTGHCVFNPDRGRQEWYMTNAGSVHWQLINKLTGKCLYPENFSTANNAAISQTTCDANSRWQHWLLQIRCTNCGDNGQDWYIFSNRQTAKCINHRSLATVGTVMLQEPCGAVDENYSDLFTWLPGD